MQRDAQGKFARKNDEYRSVRSVRLTDATWSALGRIAASLDVPRADLLEQMVRSNDCPQPGNTWIAWEIAPTTPRNEAEAQPSNTRLEEEILRLIAQVAELQQENGKLQQRVRELPVVSDLEALRERVLSSLKLGKQAPGYKMAKSALSQFIQLLPAKS